MEELDELLEVVRKAIEELTQELKSGKITWELWLEEMSRLLSTGVLTGAMLGEDSTELPQPLLELVEETVASQYSYLDNFATQIATSGAFNPVGNEEFQAGWEARAVSYANAVKVPYWKGKTKMLPLPAMPTQGTQCMGNCKCKWDIRPIRLNWGRDTVGWRCSWVRHSDDSCQTCIQREKDWENLIISQTQWGPRLEMPGTTVRFKELVEAEKHLAGEHDQKKHAGGRGRAEVEADLRKAKDAVYARMKEAKKSGDYSGIAGLRKKVRTLEDELKGAPSEAVKAGRDAYDAIVDGKGDLEDVKTLKKKVAAAKVKEKEEAQEVDLDVAPVRRVEGEYDGPLQDEVQFQAVEEMLRSNRKMDPRLSEQIKKLGYKDDMEMEQAVLGDVKRMLDRSDVYMRVPAKAMANILEDGFKNQHEVLNSRGTLDPGMREEAENMMFGIPRGSPAHKYPKYAYIANEHYGENAASAYGEVLIKFKQDVKLRTTFTAEDSLDGGLDGTVIPAPFTKPRLAALGGSSMRVLASPKNSRPTSANMLSRMATYWEAQIHGNLTARDIDSVRFVKKPKDDNVLRMLDELGIPYQVDLEY